ncbi:RecBCD enzyme subunit RecC [Shewanella sp. NFH-SH190041]|uniref:exodeoxyribonuclease V subunit gamma n=1 Tax=Shewanella sp. NFH-SH190041 TaxID=2950245 RepID=UPI0021C3F6B0|nr:exodeoxyribonuclease V subunit gamma [Shewanella sp. NFH-SH190041]BDM64056.1 RecBCD enzyme subunit RecC [Shewanella sp. NFH-SH190041]
MLHYIQSNQMEVLSEQLANLINVPHGGPLLQPEQILVQSPGMSTWLRLEIARHNGVSAAQNFPLPSSFIWQLCYLLLEGVPKENPFTKPAMTWKLMAILPGIITRENFAPLRQYLGERENSEELALKLFQLAGRIADIFDQYLVYRPDWILAWEQQEEPIPLPIEQSWQPELWRALIHYNCDKLGQSHYHRANLHQALISALTDPAQSLAALPPRLFVFGISSMAPQTLDVLAAVARRMDVFMLSLSPCQHYWGDIVDAKARARMSLAYSEKKQLPEHWEESLEVGNPLLANNGKMGREMLDMLLELDPDHLAQHECYVDPGTQTLLSGVQQDILDMETLGESLRPEPEFYLNTAKRRILAEDDDSITLRSCHSGLREVETLHDHLLQMFRRHPTLQPRDIVVMLPDVSAYAPYIDAVFSAKRGDHYIPYAIADRGAAQESPLINSFLTLLMLDRSRFGLTEVLGMLEVPAVLARFDICADELEQLKQWLQHAGIRWGRDKQASEQQGLPAFDKYSWAFGIRRMILGYALGDDTLLYHGDLPLAGIEGQASQALGKLLNFIEALDIARTLLSQQADITTRVSQLLHLLDAFYCAEPLDDSVRSDLNEIRQAIEKFRNEADQSGFGGDLSIRVLNQWFTSSLTESRVGQRYLAGSVNFCTLMPMRSIPFKLVCLLGMNDGIYPRIQYPVGFDLMAHFGPRRGDRSRRLDDRYLFLEALLSARHQLYISFIGHSERDNRERNPSMLVSELLEYCQLCYRPAGFTLQSAPALQLAQSDAASEKLSEQLLITQPLQPFDARLYRSTTSGLTRSFASQWCPPDNTEIQPLPAFITAPLATPQGISLAQLPAQELELSALIRFYRSPAQYFCQRSLKVELNLALDVREDDEPFSLNALQRYQLQLMMMEDALQQPDGEVSQALLSRLKADGQLPMAPFDDLLLAQYRRDIGPVIERTRYLRGAQEGQVCPKAPPVDIALTLPRGDSTLTLVGRIDDLYAKGLVNIRPGTTKPKDLLRVYLRHLCLNASGRHQGAYLLDMGHFHSFAALTQEQAQTLLQQLVELFFVGQATPLPFMAKTSLAYLELSYDNSVSDSEIFDALAPSWLDDAGYGDGADPFQARLFRFPDDLLDDGPHGFATLADTILGPMLSLYHHDKLSELANYVEGATRP